MTRVLLIPVLALTLLSAACANHMTLTKQQTTSVSNPIFLRPTMDKTIYVETRNTSDRPNATLTSLPQLLTARGYTLTQDPEKAHFILQVTTVSAIKAKPGTTLDALVAGGFGGMIGGSVGAATALSGHGVGFIPGGAAVGAGLGFLANKATEDTQFGLIADAQIIERTKEVVEQVVTKQAAPASGLPENRQPLASLFGGGQSLSPAHAGQSSETIQETHRGNERIHRARFAALQQQMWLDTDKSIAELSAQLAQTIAGLL